MNDKLECVSNDPTRDMGSVEVVDGAGIFPNPVDRVQAIDSPEPS
jgi:hypothetical protein